MPFNTRGHRNPQRAEAANQKHQTRKVNSNARIKRSPHSPRQARNFKWKMAIARIIVLLFQLKLDPASISKRNPDIRNQFPCVDFNVPQFGSKQSYSTKKDFAICSKSSSIESLSPKLIGLESTVRNTSEYKPGSLVKAAAFLVMNTCPATEYSDGLLNPVCIDPKTQSYAKEWAKKAGAAAPVLKNKTGEAAESDLCIQGNLCNGTLGIPRILMPSLDNPNDFLDRIHRQFGITHTRETAKMSELLPAQGEIKDTRAEGAAADMNETGKVKVKNPNGSTKFAAPIIISRDKYIVDGHHRWAAAHMKGLENNNMPVIRINAPIHDILMASALEPTNPF